MGVFMGLENRVQISESSRREILQKFLADLNICIRYGEINLTSRFLAKEISQCLLFPETRVRGESLSWGTLWG